MQVNDLLRLPTFSGGITRMLPSASLCTSIGYTASDLPVEDLLFSAGWIRYQESHENSSGNCRAICSWLSVSVIQGLDRCQVDSNGERH
jgi:hypothetical protein